MRGEIGGGEEIGIRESGGEETHIRLRIRGKRKRIGPRRVVFDEPPHNPHYKEEEERGRGGKQPITTLPISSSPRIPANSPSPIHRSASTSCVSCPLAAKATSPSRSSRPVTKSINPQSHPPPLVVKRELFFLLHGVSFFILAILLCQILGQLRDGH